MITCELKMPDNETESAYLFKIWFNYLGLFHE